MILSFHVVSLGFQSTVQAEIHENIRLNYGHVWSDMNDVIIKHFYCSFHCSWESFQCGLIFARSEQRNNVGWIVKEMGFKIIFFQIMFVKYELFYITWRRTTTKLKTSSLNESVVTQFGNPIPNC